MRYHILNGDALAEKFPLDEIPGQLIVIREAFIEGPLVKDFKKEDWDNRAVFVTIAYGADGDEYEKQFLSQLQLMQDIQSDDEVCLWFEDDLFCQTNMWFAIHYISSRTETMFFRIFPREDRISWSGFGKADENELIHCFEERVKFTEAQVLLANKLWNAYVTNDQKEMLKLSTTETKCFRFLSEVISAQLERKNENDAPGRPQQTLAEILNRGISNFYEICDEFWKQDAIYGFGDLQVYNMLKEMEVEFSGDIG